MAERDAAHEPAAEPAAPKRAGNRARVLRASPAREKLRTRERQAAFVAGDIAMRIEEQFPGRIYAIKVSCTRYKTTSTVVFDGRRSIGAKSERDGDIESDDSDDDDAGAAPALPGKKPLQTHQSPVHGTSAAQRSERNPAGGGRAAVSFGAAVGGSAGWQQPRKTARPPPQQPRPKLPADRNCISARGSSGAKAMEVEQQEFSMASMLASVRAVSQEVCPSSTFTFVKKVPIDGQEVEVPLVPASPAAEMARENPAFLGKKLKEYYLARNGAAVRELLTPATSMFGRVGPKSPPAAPAGVLGFGNPDSGGGAGATSLVPLSTG